MLRPRRPSKQPQDEEWLGTFADTITLLMCFFVLLASLAKPDPTEFEKMRASMTEQFTSEAAETPLNDAREALEQFVTSEDLMEEVMVTKTGAGIELEFDSKALFAPGSAEILPRAVPIIKEIVHQILHYSLDEYDIKVEGHTDDLPINTVQFPSNWELSTARAASVVRFFIGEGTDAERMHAIGFADTRPIMPNLDPFGQPVPENRARNRRIVIVLEKS